MIDMSKQFYLRTCTECHKAFYSEQQKKRLCPDCFKDKRKKHSEAQHKSVKKPYTRRYIPPNKPRFSIFDVCRAQEQYYQKNKEWLSYSKAAELLERGVIRV